MGWNKSITITLYPSYYIPQNPQNKIIKTSFKHYNQFISVSTEALIWLQIATDRGKKLKFETPAKKRDQKLLDFNEIYALKIEEKYYSDKDIITLTMTPMTNSSFNEHYMLWELVHRHLLQPSGSVMK